ncbi:MAG: STIV orfB116 family protein [Acidobacteriota bacterium]
MRLPPSRRLLFLNASILTAYGVYRYELVTLDRARQIIAEFRQSGCNLYSAVGHRSTAALMTRLLGVDIPFNRVAVEQLVGESAIVLCLNCRPPEGMVLSLADIEAIGYELGLMTRLE